MSKLTLAQYIREKLSQVPAEQICKNLKIDTIGEGHLADETTEVYLDKQGDVEYVYRPGIDPKPGTFQSGEVREVDEVEEILAEDADENPIVEEDRDEYTDAEYEEETEGEVVWDDEEDEVD